MKIPCLSVYPASSCQISRHPTSSSALAGAQNPLPALFVFPRCLLSFVPHPRRHSPGFSSPPRSDPSSSHSLAPISLFIYLSLSSRFCPRRIHCSVLQFSGELGASAWSALSPVVAELVR
nr:uncharacterized protein LOC112280857 [Physcomitrium patens]|eukprot:XP_024372512.1 uncharacterized protein LOC112280857 [Physcomitrella patens]